MGVFSLLFVALFVVKIAGVVAISWWLVFSPIIAYIILCIIFILLIPLLARWS